MMTTSMGSQNRYQEINETEEDDKADMLPLVKSESERLTPEPAVA